MPIVAYYPLDGNAKDRSGANRHGTPTNVTYTTGQFGQAAVFNGINSKVDMGVEFAPIGNVTYMAWIKPDVLAVNRRFLNQRGPDAGDFIFRILDATGAIDFLRFTGAGGFWRWSSTLTVAQGVWSHVAVVYDGTINATFVINGVSQSIVRTLDSTSLTSENLVIGADNVGNFFDGAIDEVRIYNEALTEDQINMLFHHNYLRVLALSV